MNDHYRCIGLDENDYCVDPKWFSEKVVAWKDAMLGWM
jgi:hypothetical protein